MSLQQPVRILILGGGFGGLHTALELERRLKPSAPVQITLVNRENFFLFTPMLHEVAASDLDITTIVSPIRKLLTRTTFFAGQVEAVDLAARRVTVSHGQRHHHHELPYDHLVIALGAVTNFFGIPGLEEGCALTMKSLGDAVTLRNHVIQRLEEAATECAAGLREELLTFVVAGGGFAGVETVAAVHDFIHEALPHYPSLTSKEVRVLLVQGGDRILPELDERLGRYAGRQLAARGVELRLNTRVTHASVDGVTLSDGTTWRTQTLVWTAGSSPHPLVQGLPCRLERGRLLVDRYLRVQAWPGVWALGDCAAVPDHQTGRPCPPTAQHALREARTLGRNIAAVIRGAELTPFRFSALGQLASIGRRTGVANILGINFSGFLAWWMWRTIYLSKLPRFEKKVRVALDWTLDLVFSKDLVQFLTLRSQSVSHAPEAGAGLTTGDAVVRPVLVAPDPPGAGAAA